MVFDRRKFLTAAGVFAAFTMPVVLAPVVRAQDATQKTDTPPSAKEDKKKQKNLAKGEAEAKRMLMLMDKDQNGMVSKAEFMAFMEAEFNRLDKNGDGELNVKELTESQVHLRAAPVHR